VKGCKGIVQNILESQYFVERIDIEVLTRAFKMSGINNNNSEECKKSSEPGVHTLTLRWRDRYSDVFEIVLEYLLYYDYVSKYVSSLINFFLLNWGFIVRMTPIMFCFGLDLWAWIKIEICCFLLKLLIVNWLG